MVIYLKDQLKPLLIITKVKLLGKRRILHYPPATQLMAIQVSAKEEAVLNEAVSQMHRWILSMKESEGLELIGPAEAPVYKVNDIYRKILYLKENRGL